MSEEREREEGLNQAEMWLDQAQKRREGAKKKRMLNMVNIKKSDNDGTNTVSSASVSLNPVQDAVQGASAPIHDSNPPSASAATTLPPPHKEKQTTGRRRGVREPHTHTHTHTHCIPDVNYSNQVNNEHYSPFAEVHCRKEMICYRCGKAGHIARECRAPGSGGRRGRGGGWRGRGGRGGGGRDDGGCSRHGDSHHQDHNQPPA